MHQGIIVFKLSYVGSKSQSVQPYLYKGNAEFIRVYMIGDHPFQNDKLKEFDGKKVTVEGKMNENDILEIDSITLLK